MEFNSCPLPSLWQSIHRSLQHPSQPSSPQHLANSNSASAAARAICDVYPADVYGVMQIFSAWDAVRGGCCGNAGDGEEEGAGHVGDGVMEYLSTMAN